MSTAVEKTFAAPPEVARLQRPALIVGAVFLLLLVAGIFLPHGTGQNQVPGITQFFRSYLLGFVFWTGVSVGCLGLLMLQHNIRGAWGMVIRRVLEAGTRTLPLMLVLFLPLAIFGLPHIYEWVNPQGFHATERSIEIINSKRGYLNVPFFLIRSFIYFALWIGLMYVLNLWSREQDRTSEHGLIKKMQRVSGPGLGIFILSVTFASIDWVMSLEPEWFSTIFGLLFVAGWNLSAFSFVIVVMFWLSERRPMNEVLLPRHFHDLGKLLLAFVMLWAYFAFSQYLIIWAGNLPEEIKWYLYRTRGGWGWVGILLPILHFAIPFLMLLSRDLKRNASKLAAVALAILVMRFIDLVWIIVPEFHKGAFAMSWMDVVSPVAIGGLWLAYFAWQLQQRPLVPTGDSRLAEAMEEHGGH
ncbi:MAG: hypothetical protein AUG51_13455 [Acidobacteria bacterium 13_1_20CM_3_53_8]|nr:MAG: hypothetical protein AUG51_13455 [Acidobacteria bacterium 13_1_20CM_3_53_8]